MRWQRIARLVFAAAGIGCAVALYALTRERPPAPVETAAPPIAPGVSLTSSGGVANRYRLNLLVATIEHNGEDVFEDGRVVWKNATMTFKEDGSVISAATIESKGKSNKGLPAELILHGQVKLVGKDGASAEAEDATFNENTGILTIPADVKFSRGRMSGTGKRATYTRDTGVFRVEEDSHVVLTPADGSSPVDARSTTVTFNRANRSLLFEGQAVITRTGETMASDTATLYLADTDDTFRVIELRAHARVTPVPGRPSTVPDMSADNIDLAFYPGTQSLQQGRLMGSARMVQTSENGPRAITAPNIDFGTAPDGNTLTRLDARRPVLVELPASKDAPQRTVNAQSLIAQGDDQKGLTRALFEGGVTFREKIPATGGQAARDRTGTAQTLSLALKGQLDSIDDATFQDNVKFVDGDVTGVADIGIYYASRGELWLQPFAKAQKRQTNVVSQDTTIDAAEIIKVFLETDNVYAKRDVRTLMRNTEKDAKPSNSTLFDPTNDVFGFADEFSYDSATRTAKYTGLKTKPAELQQRDKKNPAEMTDVYGLELVLNKDTRDLTASGQVRSVFSVTDDGGSTARSAAPTRRRYDITADSLIYKDAARLATYNGTSSLAHLKAGSDGDIQASQIVLTMAEASRTLERLEATRHPGDAELLATLEGGREATGDVLIYDATTGRYRLKGKPLKLKSKETDGTCSLSMGSEALFTREGGDPQFPRELNPGGSSSKKLPDCAVPLRAIK